MTTQLEDDLHTLFDAQTRSLGLGAGPNLERSAVARTYDLKPGTRLSPVWWAAAAVVTIGLAGLAAAIAVRDTDSEDSAVAQPTPPAIPAAAPSFPVFGGATMANATIVPGEWIGEVYDPPVLHATLGRVTGDRISDIVHLTVATSDTPQSSMTGAERSEETVSGRSVTRYTVDVPEPIPDVDILAWNVNDFRIMMNDSAVAEVLIQELMPTTFADSAHSIELPNPINNLPPEWELLAGPTEFDSASGPNLSATTADGSSVTLHVWPTLMMTGSDWTVVQIGTEQAFLDPVHEGTDGLDVAGLAWRTPTGDWAVVTGVGEFAHQLERVSADITWVDHDAWQDLYGPANTNSEAPALSPTDTATTDTSA